MDWSNHITVQILCIQQQERFYHFTAKRSSVPCHWIYTVQLHIKRFKVRVFVDRCQGPHVAQENVHFQLTINWQLRDMTDRYERVQQDASNSSAHDGTYYSDLQVTLRVSRSTNTPSSQQPASLSW